MSFEQVLERGRLDEARSLLDELARRPEADRRGLSLADSYADLAELFDRGGRYDDAIAAMKRAIEHGRGGRPDPRCCLAEFHLRAGRNAEAARIWADLKARHPEDVLLYQSAGLSYSEAGEHELAVRWLGEGIEVAITTEDPQGVVSDLSEARRRSLATLGRAPDELSRRAGEFVARRRGSMDELRPRVAREIGDLLEPDETVISAVYVDGRSRRERWLSGSGGVAWWECYAHLAAITQRNVYVFPASRYSRRSEVLLKAPLGSVDASFEPGVYGLRRATLRIGDYKLRLPRNGLQRGVEKRKDQRDDRGSIRMRGTRRFAGGVERAQQIAREASGNHGIPG